MVPDIRHGPDGMQKERMRLMDMLSHDLANHQQAALGFLELLDRSEQMPDVDRRLIARTVESLGHSARLLLQVRALLAKAEQATAQPGPVRLDRVLEAARMAVEGVFFTHRIRFVMDGPHGAQTVKADALLIEALTQLLVLLADGAPTDRECALKMGTSPTDGNVRLSLWSEGFALDPRVTEALTRERDRPGPARTTERVSLVRELLDHYGASTRLEPIQGSVGAALAIYLPGWDLQ